ncbi:hypothetical protein [Streptomyces cellostaticus]|uniref:hypothetical protein n=1 Tax=Streptomyces cellostaticus TaxID=67285 RepID=UPI00099E1C1F|nr:hypothetical protein [Streptomyces cellostaticus]
MANPGYGKRCAPSQLPRTKNDFAHLPPREAAIAAYIDRLPDGADISVKTLAKQLLYGQCALRTALNHLQRSGHLRRGRERLEAEGGGSRWITRSWWSRTARADDWWAAFTRGDVPEPEQPPDERARTTRSRAHILRALTEGLPTPVHHPAALVRRRLIDKLPPEPVPRPPRRVLECAKCGVPGRPEALPGGVCGGCRGERAPARPRTPLPAPAVHVHAGEIRAAMSLKRRERTHV